MMEKEGREHYQALQWFNQAEDEIDIDTKRLEYEMKRRRFESQERILNNLTWAFVGSMILTFMIFLFQGFHVEGFNLDTTVLVFLGGATIGEIAGLLTIAINTVSGLRQQ